eukprot:7388664-Pyramimonas_sp.AAC.1
MAPRECPSMRHFWTPVKLPEDAEWWLQEGSKRSATMPQEDPKAHVVGYPVGAPQKHGSACAAVLSWGPDGPPEKLQGGPKGAAQRPQDGTERTRDTR